MNLIIHLMFIVNVLAFPYKPTPEELVKSTVSLSNDEIEGFCSGVAVKTKLGTGVLTARHCIPDDGETVEFCTLGGKQHCWSANEALRPTGKDQGDDWLFYPSEIPNEVKTRKLRQHKAKLGEEVYQVGGGRGGPWFSHGHIASIKEQDSDLVLGIDGFTWFGMSGGPVYDTKGRVIGIISALEVGGGLYGPQMLPNKGIAAGVRTTGL